MNISVFMCTWNNSKRLAITLDSLSQCEVPQGVQWEIVLVNNNCKDDTDAVVEKFKGKLPIVYVHEPQQGVSRAKNTGLASVSGELVILTDDDVTVCQEWMEIYWKAYQKNPAGFFWGGPVESEFEDPSIPPKLIAVHIDYAINGFALPREGEPERPNIRFIGANWACPLRLIKEEGGFNSSLGLNAVAGQLTLGEEADLMQRLMDRGVKRWYLPGARIRHFVPREKTSMSYIARRSQTQGRESFYRLVWNKNRPKILGVPLLVYKTIVLSWVKWHWSRLQGHPDYQQYVNRWYYSGMWQGFYKNSKG